VFNGVATDHIYVINIQRARLKERLDAGNWQLPLSGANGVFTFIDDSGELYSANSSPAGAVYNIVSGSITSLSGSVIAANSSSVGLVYPDLGVIVLNPDVICPLVGFYTSGSSPSAPLGGLTGSSAVIPVYASSNLNTLETAEPFAPFTGSDITANWGSELAAYNAAGLFVSINNAVVDSTFEFRARSAETISSTHYFVRLRNREYNYSNNPTFRDPDNNTILISGFRTDPKVYITTVGLYNDANELLGVAKLSKPVRKSFSEEILLRVRLDF
jgi:hypothetical protein